VNKKMIRKLKDYQWDGDATQKKIEAFNKKLKQQITLKKIGFMSFIRFGFSFLDNMRIEEIKAERLKAFKLREQIRKSKEEIKKLKKEIKFLKSAKHTEPKNE